MNQGYLAHSQAQISSAAPYATHSQTAGEMTQYSAYPQHPSMHGAAGSYGTQYASQYYGAVTSPQSATNPVSTSMGMTNQLAPLPNLQMSQQPAYGASAGHSQGYSQPQQSHQQPPHTFDQTGQVQPPGAKPRVTATLWEDEGSLCFQVEAKGVCVARREDNHFINGTKLLNVAGMTRGRRDGILKSEKTRHVVKIGPMHLKGVWIPFDRALDFANREKITELLYPLFVHNISSLLYHPQNAGNRGNNALERKNRDRPATAISGAPQSSGLTHSMSGQMPPQSPHSIAPHPTLSRPQIDRAHTFPTPPTSASAVPQSGGYDWGSQSIPSAVQTAQPLAIDTGLSNTRSMPSTPATTPPGSSMQNMQSYSGSMYSGPQQTPGQYATQQQNLARFGAPMPAHGYIKNEMGPPSRGNIQGDGDHAEIKTESYGQGHGVESVSHGAGEGDHEGDYSAENSHSYNTSRPPYNYTPTSTIGSLSGEHVGIGVDHADSSPHQSGSGRGTPRTAVNQPSWQTGYHTPPRTGTSGSLYGAIGEPRGSMINGAVGEYNQTGYPMNGNVSNKRGREDDDDYKPHSMNGESLDAMKRRKSNREGSISGPPGMPFNYGPGSAIMQGAHR